MTCLFGQDDIVIPAVAKELGLRDFGPATSIGFVEGDRLVGGVVYHGYWDRLDGTPGGIEASIATVSPKWATRSVLRTIFAYPFVQLGVHRLQVACHRKNREARQFVERLGFVYEGMARKAFPTGGDAAVYSMLRKECRWIDGEKG
jgi:RimJ/RimL family protein N-acetyltransferase